MGHGGLLRAFCFAHPIRGPGDLLLDMPRQTETWVSLCNLMLKLRGISRYIGSNSPHLALSGLTVRLPV